MKRLFYFFVFSFIITVCVNSQDTADDKIEPQNSCYNEISQKLKTNYLLTVKQTNGQTFSGYLKNVQKDSLTIKFQKEKYQSPVLYNIGLNNIDSIYFNGINRQYDFLKAKNLAAVGGVLGFFVGYSTRHDVFQNYENHTGRVVGFTLGGIALGALIGHLFESANKTPPLNIVINCN